MGEGREGGGKGGEGRRREGEGEKLGMGTRKGEAVRGRMGAGRRGGGVCPMLQSDSPLPHVPSPSPSPLYRPVDPSLPNSSAWPLGRWLKVGPDTFSVQYNPPVVDKVTLVKRALAGHEILATPQVWTGV